MFQLIFNDEKHTFDDWGLYLERLDIGTPSPKEVYIDLPSGDGALDLTEALTGEVSYRSRTIEAIFGVKMDYSNDWKQTISAIENYLNGKNKTMIVSDDLDYFYEGRWRVVFERRKPKGILRLIGTCQPYKLKTSLTTINRTIGSNGVLNLTLTNSRKRVIPVIEVSNTTTIEFGTLTRVVQKGTHKITNIVLTEGDNSIRFIANQGTEITVQYQEGAL